MRTETAPSAGSSTALQTSWAKDFSRDGFLALPGLLSAAEVSAVRAEATRICRGDLGTFAGGVGTAELDDDALLRAYLCIHFPHKLSTLMLELLSHPRIVEVLTAVIGPNVKAMQSMLFIKSEGKPGQAWHQDEWFIPTRDRSLTAAWVALDDARVDNGCLWVIPGSHRRGILWPQREHDDPRFDCTAESHGFPYQDSDARPIEVAAGSVVFFNGYLLHRSLPNTSARGLRRAVANHYMSAESLLPWLDVTGHVGAADYRDVVLVAGEDPYAWKGTESRATPMVRPDREGGCLKGAR